MGPLPFRSPDKSDSACTDDQDSGSDGVIGGGSVLPLEKTGLFPDTVGLPSVDLVGINS